MVTMTNKMTTAASVGNSNTNTNTNNDYDYDDQPVNDKAIYLSV